MVNHQKLFFIILLFSISISLKSQNKYPLSNQINESTVKIDLIENGKIFGSGSGFILGYIIEDSIRVPCLISNKHILQAADTILLTFNGELETLSSQDSVIIRVIVDLNLYEVIPHPNNDVDLAALPLNPIEHQLKQQNFTLRYKVITEDFIPASDEFSKFNVVNDILLVGYPIGLSDTSHNSPIFRKGITATNPSVKYNSKNVFLIDAACFPGSSGSPVFLISSNVQRRTNQIMFGESISLIGVLYGGLEYTIEGEVKVVHIPNKMDLKLLTNVPINLGVVINARELLKIKDALYNIIKRYR